MFRLYGFFTQNTLKALYVLEEVGADYDFEFVDLSKLRQRSWSKVECSIFFNAAAIA